MTAQFWSELTTDDLARRDMGRAIGPPWQAAHKLAAAAAIAAIG